MLFTLITIDLKVLIFSGKGSSVTCVFQAGFERNGHEVRVIDYTERISKQFIYLDNRGNYFPYKYRHYLRRALLRKIQKIYVQEATTYLPDLILVYNDQMLCGETVTKIKGTVKTKIVVYLADSPLYLNRREHLLPLLKQVDHVFAPDSYWIVQLKMLGIRNLHFIIPGFNPSFFKKPVGKEEYDKFKADLMYTGSPYNDIWGRKRAMFLNCFSRMDIKIYGPKGWVRWLNDFPDLKERFIFPSARINDETLNTMLNCCRIYPVDANPGIINGVHIRVFDCIAAGILPIVEYRKDLHDVFDKDLIPTIYNYNEAEEMATYFLAHPEECGERIKKLSALIYTEYSPEIANSRIVNTIFG